MIKDLVVTLGTDGGRDAAARFAISIAAAFKAHLFGIAFAFDPVIAPTVMDGLSAEWIDARRNENYAAAQAAIDSFETAARAQGVSVAHDLTDSSLGGAAGIFGRLARRFDLAVVGQGERGRTTPDDLFIEAALFDSGRPVIVVPYIQDRGLKLDRILVCWDASRSATRAIGDAMPFLRRGKTIEIVTVSGHGNGADEFPHVDLAAHLARHDLAAETTSLVADHVDVANVILAHAADSAADFIVMGGYGHSRMREFIFGGATRGMLEQMTVPTLMSH